MKEHVIASLTEHLGLNHKHQTLYDTLVGRAIDSVDYCNECKQLSAAERSLPELTVKVLDKLLPVFDIVGVQPMTAAVSQFFTMTYTSAGNNKIIRGTNTKRYKPVSGAMSLQVMSNTAQITPTTLMAIDSGKSVDDVAGDIARNIYSRILATIVQSPAKSHAPTFAENLVMLINVSANLIAVRTRRGCGNRIIISGNLLPILKKSGLYVGVPHKNGCVIDHVGIMSGIYQVHVDKTAPDGFCHIGYTGANAVDAGAFYLPYKLVTMNNGEYITEDCITMNPSAANNVANGADYFETLMFDTSNIT